MVEQTYIDLQIELLKSNRSEIPDIIQSQLITVYKRDPNFRVQYKARFKNNGIYDINSNQLQNWIKTIYKGQDYLRFLTME
jgi:hypothetical protein